MTAWSSAAAIRSCRARVKWCPPANGSRVSDTAVVTTVGRVGGHNRHDTNMMLHYAKDWNRVINTMSTFMRPFTHRAWGWSLNQQGRAMRAALVAILLLVALMASSDASAARQCAFEQHDVRIVDGVEVRSGYYVSDCPD